MQIGFIAMQRREWKWSKKFIRRRRTLRTELFWIYRMNLFLIVFAITNTKGETLETGSRNMMLLLILTEFMLFSLMFPCKVLWSRFFFNSRFVIKIFNVTLMSAAFHQQTYNINIYLYITVNQNVDLQWSFWSEELWILKIKYCSEM